MYSFQSGTCTLREATVFSSVLARVSIPMFHAAAAMLKVSHYCLPAFLQPTITKITSLTIHYAHTNDVPVWPISPISRCWFYIRRN